MHSSFSVGLYSTTWLMGVVKFMLYLTTLVDSLIPPSHLIASVGMIQPHYPLTISMWHFLMHHLSGGIALLVRNVREHWFCIWASLLSIFQWIQHQKVILAGCFSGVEEDQAWEVLQLHNLFLPYCVKQRRLTLVWLHVLRSSGTRKLVCSPDTDVYHIGLPLICNQSMDVFVCISMFSSQEHRYLSLNSLLTSLQGDPDFPRELLPKAQQTLFICTGCDYVSYFAGFGKLTFFQHASFINIVSQGTLASMWY